MSCPRTHLIVRLVAGEMADAEERGLRQHLATCPDCAAAFEDMRGTWDDLGAWTVDVSKANLTDRVLAQAADQDGPVRHPLFIAIFKASRLRVAASIAAAAGLGIVAGTLAPGGWGWPGSPSSSVPTAVELAEALGLTEFATQSATGLPPGVEPDAPTGAEVEP